VQGATRQLIAFAREKVGDDAAGEIVGAIPPPFAICLSTHVVAA
jgi:hypothetical protein